MRVREIIEISKWVNGSGEQYNTIFSNKVIELAADTQEEIKEFFDWDFWEKEELAENEDLKITVEYFEVDADIECNEPIAKFETWQSEIA